MPYRNRFVWVALLVASCLYFIDDFCFAESRTALVIGISEYEKARLTNTVNDAEDMAESLHNMGFEVTKLKNPDFRQMEEAINAFYQKIKSKQGTGLFYYAGHGIQVKGQNYLIPMGANIESESDAAYKGLDAARVLGKMEDAGNKVNIVILDACRDNPFARNFRSNTKGLSRMDAPAGSLIAYSTAPGSVASDGDGRNGIFTGYFIKHMKTPGLSIEQVLKQTRRDVMAVTNNQQVPWESSSLTGDFLFQAAEMSQQQDNRGKPPSSISLDANIKEATVQIDGQPVGIIPIINLAISPGEHRILVTKEGYNTYETTINVLEGKGYHLSIQLEPIQGNQAAKRNQQDWRDPDMKQKFIWVLGGCLDVESTNQGTGEHTKLSEQNNCVDSFWLSDTEVTVGQWRKFANETGYKTEAETDGGAWIRTESGWMKQEGMFWDKPGFSQTDDHPVTGISLKDVETFTKWINSKGVGTFRLPTDKEWEFACQARFSNGRNWELEETEACQYGNLADASIRMKPPKSTFFLCDDGNPETSKTGSLKPNPLGFYDILGNVWEWCYESGPNAGANRGDGPTSAAAQRHIIRGGSWNASPEFARCQSQLRVDPATRTNSLGFRLLRVAN